MSECQSKHHDEYLEYIEYKGELWCDGCFTGYADKEAVERWYAEKGIEKPTAEEVAASMERVSKSLAERAAEVRAKGTIE